MITSLIARRRFEEKFIVTPGCWIWSAGGGGRYGGFSYNYQKIGAHVASYRIYCGPIPAGLMVRHTCDNSLCVNPTHLELGTHQENMQDCVDRGRRPVAEQHANAKLTNLQVLEVREALANGASLAGLGRRYGVSSCLISNIKQGRAYKTIY